LRAWALSAGLVIAADRGADLCLAAGVVPQVIVGDLDSISDRAREAVSDVRLMGSPEKTDCDKLLNTAFDMGAAAVTLTAVEGDLPDHALSVLHSAARAQGEVRLAYRRGVGWIVKTRQTVAAAAGRRVSLLPITHCEGVRLSGVQWPLENAVLDPNGLTSISNRATGSLVGVTLGSGIALLFVEFTPDEVPFW
jgi:thiamine pyrophosphokinase